MQSKNRQYKSWLEISRRNVIHNFEVFQKIVGKATQVGAVVKANAYGHGLPEVVSILKSEVRFYAVDAARDALGIRKLNKTSGILVMGYIEEGLIPELIRENISFVVFDMTLLRKIVGLNLEKSARIHLKIETGLNRLGFDKKTLPVVLDYIKKHKDKLLPEGVYTHLANIEDTDNPSFTNHQIEEFNKALDLIKKYGFNPRFIHSAATGAALLYPLTRFSLVRVGIGLYGLWPSEENKFLARKLYKKIELMPVLTWKSIVAQVKEMEKGETVGYGRTWSAKKRTKIAVIPVGYWDGYDRRLGNLGKVLIKGFFAKIVGRVAMNMFMVDVTKVPGVKQGDEVILIGEDHNKHITADDLADRLGTINYEVVSRINPSLPRIII